MAAPPSILFSGLGAAANQPAPLKNVIRFGGKKVPQRGLFSAKRLVERDEKREPIELEQMRHEEQHTIAREALDKRESLRHCGYCNWWEPDRGVGFLRLWDSDDIESPEIYTEQSALPKGCHSLEAGCAVRFRLSRHHGANFATELAFVCPWRFCQHAPRNAEPPWGREEALQAESPREEDSSTVTGELERGAPAVEPTAATTRGMVAVAPETATDAAEETNTVARGNHDEEHDQPATAKDTERHVEEEDLVDPTKEEEQVWRDLGGASLEQIEQEEHHAAESSTALLDRFRLVYDNVHTQVGTFV